MNDHEAQSDGAASASEPPQKRRRWLRRTLIGLAALVVLGVVSVELYARFGLGLGDPPLYQPHETIEYLCKPGEYHRFGNTIRINDHHMRSEPITPQRSSDDELRVVFIGDSVLHGGALTDQAALATTMLQRRLNEKLDAPVKVANISAGSWGPPNMLAYFEAFGFFDADVVVIVLSSHDVQDAPTFEPLDPEALPTRAPVLALEEAVGRYLVQYAKWHWLGGKEAAKADSVESPDVELDMAQVAVCEAALQEMVLAAERAGARVLLVQHVAYKELEEGAEPGKRRLAITGRAAGATVIDMQQPYTTGLRSGQPIFRDYIHLSDSGQKLLADELEGRLVELLRRSAGGF